MKLIKSKNMKPLYTAQCSTMKANKPYGAIHFSECGDQTICGQEINEKWVILTNRHDGETTCKKCHRIWEKAQAPPIADLLCVEENKHLIAENKRLKEEIADHIENTQSALAERNALAGDLERERDGMIKLRKEFGAHDDETVWQFVERLAKLSDQDELRSLRLKAKDDAACLSRIATDQLIDGFAKEMSSRLDIANYANSPEMKAMKRVAAILKTRGNQ